MNKLIVCDFENVLINKNEEIPMSTVILIDELRRSNNKFVVITNNSLNKILYYNKDFSFIDYIVYGDGSSVYDTNLEKIVYKKNILGSNVSKIIKNFYNDSSIYLIDDYNYVSINDNKYYDLDCLIIDNYEEYLKDNKSNIKKIELHFKNKKCMEEVSKKLELLNLKININTRKSNDFYIIDIVSSDTDIYTFINKISAKNKIDDEDIIYFGINSNLLENINNVVIPKNIKIKSKIKKDICDSSDNKGLEKYLNEYFKKM